MDYSVFLAQAFGLYFVIVSLAMLFKKQHFEDIIDDLLDSPACIFIIAVISLIFGIILVLLHNIWVMDWRVIITILAWLTLTTGVVRTFFPGFVAGMAKQIHNQVLYYVITTMSLILGLYLGYVGFS